MTRNERERERERESDVKVDRQGFSWGSRVENMAASGENMVAHRFVIREFSIWD